MVIVAMMKVVIWHEQDASNVKQRDEDEGCRVI